MSDESGMIDRSIFISSCTRRQLARRRPSPNAYRIQLMIAIAVLSVAMIAFAAVRLSL
jgi:hypothetical protein